VIGRRDKQRLVQGGDKHVTLNVGQDLGQIDALTCLALDCLPDQPCTTNNKQRVDVLVHTKEGGGWRKGRGGGVGLENIAMGCWVEVEDGGRQDFGICRSEGYK